MDDENLLNGQSVAKVAGNLLPPHGGAVRIVDAHAAGRIFLDDAEHANVPAATDIRAIVEALQTWSLAPITYCVLMASDVPGLFCTGMLRTGDAVAAPDSAQRAQGLAAEAYKLTWLLDCFTKPIVALIDGPVSGTGVGLSLFATHRVAGERFRLSMPGPTIGWFPDHGTAQVLARLAGEIGMYLALTGRGLGRNDAFDLGLLTQRVDAQHFAAVTAALSDADPVDPLLDALDRDAGPRDLAPGTKEAIARCFSADSIEGILARLEGETGNARAWAETTAREIARCPPLALKITYRLLREARALDLRATLQLDYRIASRLLGEPGRIDAARVATLGAVDDELVSRYFAPLPDGDLPLPPRIDLQADGP